MTNTFTDENWGGVKCTLTEDGVLTINTKELTDVVIDTTETETNNYVVPWNNYRSQVKSVIIKGHISFKEGSSLSRLFYNLGNCTSIDGLTNSDTSNVTDMENMFDSCKALTSLDLSNWNTSNVKYMNKMFNGCSQLNTIIVPKRFSTTTKSHFKIYCNGWYDINNKQLTYGNEIYEVMLYRLSTTVSINLTNTWNNDTNSCYWKLSGTTLTIYSTNSHNLGSNASDLTNQDEIKNNKGNITEIFIRGSTITFNNSTNLSGLFEGFSSCTSIEGLENFDLTNVDDIIRMFYGCGKLQTLNLSSWNLTSKSIAQMFYGLTSLYYIITPKGFDDVFRNELYDDNSFKCLNYRGVKLSSQTNIQHQQLYFTQTPKWCYSLENSCYWSYNNNILTIYSDEINNKANDAIELKSQFDISEDVELVKPDEIKQVEIEGSIVFVEGTDLSWLFYNFYNCDLFNGLENLDVSKVIDMTGMFHLDDTSSNRKFETLNISNWNTSKVTSMRQMFTRCSNLTSLDLSNWNTSKVTNMRQMFAYCDNLTSLDLSNWNTSNVGRTNDMFNSCSKLTELNLNNFSLINITNKRNIIGMLYNLNNLETIITPYQFDSNGLFQAEFTTNLRNRNLKECDTGKLVNNTTTIKQSFIYTNNETLISNTQKLCSNIVGIMN